MHNVRTLLGAALVGLLIAAGSLPSAGHATGIVAHAAAAPVTGGTLIDGLFEEPFGLLPNTGFIAFSIMVQETLFSPLFYTDAQGVLHPGLAAEIPTVANGDISADGLTYTFKLRPGLLWSDGQPLDA